MSFKRFLVGVGVGFLAGTLFRDTIKNELISPEKALRIVKQRVGKEGAVEGSWIHMVPEEFEKQLLNYNVYRGGVSATIEGDFYQFDFVVDAHTGTILELTSQD